MSRKKGLTFRMKALKTLINSSLVKTNIIIRSSYSGHKETIREDPVRSRRQYLGNMLNSDLALAIKGDGNYSYRFYEALSLGRVPILLDTDCVLPLENIIDYKEFVIFVNAEDVSRIDEVVAEKWGNISNDKFLSMQRRAREMFEKYLSTKSYLRYVADNVL